LVLGSAGLFGGGRALGADTTLTIIAGDVSVRHGTGANFIAGVDGEVLKGGDAIKTADDARAVLTYFEGSTVTIEPGTVLSIDEAFAAQGSRSIRMTQDIGRTWHVVSKLLSSNSKYEVRTPASTASVRGTAFEVANQGPITTLSTSEGMVVSQVADPVQPGKTVEVEVPAGNQQTQEVNAPPAPTKQAPPPERKVTVTVEATNSIVVDPLGRANGITKDGKIVIQTPGAKVKVENGTVVIEMPDLPDGKLATRVEKEKDSTKSSDNVKVTTTIDEKGKSEVVQDVAKRDQDKKGTTGIEIKKDASGATKGRALGGDETKTLPTVKGADVTGAFTGNRDNNSKTVEPTSSERARETKGPDKGTTQGNTPDLPQNNTTVPNKDTTGDKNTSDKTADTSGEKKGTSDQTGKDDANQGQRAPASPPTNFVPDVRLTNPLEQLQKEQLLREQQQKAAEEARQKAADEQRQREQVLKEQQQKADQQKADQQKADQLLKDQQQKADQQKAEQQKAEQQKAAQLKEQQQKADQLKADQEKAAQLKEQQQKAEQQKADQLKADQEKAAQLKEQQQRADELRRRQLEKKVGG
jgi:hypothetical protein